MSPMPKSRTVILNELREKVGQLPTVPGVYLFKDARGVVLYVGKAKTLAAAWRATSSPPRTCWPAAGRTSSG